MENTENKYPRGSEWRKWDLHIHTPKSISNNYGGDNEQVWEKFIEALERLPHDVKVIGINDYYFIDGYEKVMKYKAQGRLNNIDKIFPILEFRIDTFGSGSENKLQKINLHILFDVCEQNIVNEIKKIREEFINLIPITSLEKHQTKKLSIDNFIAEGGSLQAGFSSFIPPTKKVFELASSSTWKDRVFIFLGYKEWSNLDKNQQLKPFKEDLYSKAGAFFSSNYDTIERSQEWLNEYGNKRLLHSLDIHDFNTLDTANIDENGDFLERKNYICNTWIKANPSFAGLKQILFEPQNRVAIQETHPDNKPDYQVIDSIELKEPGFWEQTIFLNPYLNTIIGGRSTGKSTLLQCIALNLDSSIKFDDDKRREFVESHYKNIIVRWKDGEESVHREITYFPQNQMIKLAESKVKLDNLIDDIVKDKDQNHQIEDYKQFCEQNRIELSSLINQLFLVQSKINNLKAILKEKGDTRSLQLAIEKLAEKIKSLNNNSQISENELQIYNGKITAITEKGSAIKIAENDIRILDSIESDNIFNTFYENELSSLSEDSNKELIDYLKELKTDLMTKWIAKIHSYKEELAQKIEKQVQEINSIKSDNIYSKGQNYLAKNKEYSELQDQMKMEQEKLAEIKEIENQLNAETANKENIFTNVVNKHILFSSKLKELVTLIQYSGSDVSIISDIKFKNKELKDFLTTRHNLRGTDRQNYIDEFMTNYHSDTNMESALKMYLNNALNNMIDYKSGNTANIVVSELFSTNWFDITYELKYEDDSFDDMSQGKKSFVILKLLLDFSSKKCPILIDQPEDSLDNRAIYHELVQYLRNKKISRQLIIVTHNANVVVSADSENVIVSNQQGIKNKNHNNIKFCYVNGALEETSKRKSDSEFILDSCGIREHVCDILEGGVDAFKEREQKYGLSS